VSDILFVTKVDPFMTLLQKKGIDTLTEAVGSFTAPDANASVFTEVGLNDADKPKLEARLQSGKGLVFKANAANAGMKGLAVIADAESTNATLLPKYRIMLGQLNDKGIDAAKAILQASELGDLRSGVAYFRAHDEVRKLVTNMVGGDVLIKLPYQGAKISTASVNVAYIDWSVDGINTVAAEDIVAIQAKVAEDGYVIFKASATGFYFIADK